MRTSAGRPSPAQCALFVVAGLTLTGLAVRLASFDDSLFADELSTYFVVHGRSLAGVVRMVGGDAETTPPLYYVLAWVVQGIGSPAEGLRLVSLLAGVAAIPLTYLLGVRTIGRAGALVGAALVALSPFLIFFSTEARSYQLTMLLALAAVLALLNALDEGRARWWWAYAALSAASIYAHYTAVFVLLGAFGWAAVVYPQARHRLLLCNLGAAVLFVPWLPGFLEDRHGPATYLLEAAKPFRLGSALDDLGNWALASPTAPVDLPKGPGAVADASIPGRAAVAIIAAGLLLAAAAVALRGLREGGRWHVSPKLALILVLALITPAGVALYSLVGDAIFLPRNLIASWPGLALAAGALLASARGAAAVAATALVLGGFASGAAKLTEADYGRPDYGGAAAFIARSGAPGDPVIELPMATPLPQTGLEAAFGPPDGPTSGDHPVIVMRLPDLSERKALVLPDGAGPLGLLFLPGETPEGAAARAAELARTGTIFLVAPGEAGTAYGGDRDRAVESFLAALGPGFELEQVRTFPGLGGDAVGVGVLRAKGSGAAL